MRKPCLGSRWNYLEVCAELIQKQWEQDNTTEELGSPHLSIRRAFKAVFDLPQSRRSLIKVASHTYRNPVYLALEWRKALDDGKFASQAELARSLGVSKARVTQILRLLRLPPEVLDMIASLGDPLLSPRVTERRLRAVVDLAPKDQRRSLGDLHKMGVALHSRDNGPRGIGTASSHSKENK